MVYCGRPSKACSECRVKRRRCDLRKPSCSQCQRAGIQCTGFRDIRSLVFRDQSAQFPRHRSQTRSRPSDASASTTAANDGLVPRTSEQCQNRLIPSALTHPLPANLHTRNSLPFDNQAFQFFTYHYLWRDIPLPDNDSSCFTTIYSQSPAHGYLSNAIDAVGMASLANLHNSPRLRQAAQERYHVVIRDVRVALTDSIHASSDQMLVAVMLLNIYETVTCDDTNPSSWNQHANGASVLLQLRGLEQLQNPIGLNIFSHLCADILISCLQQRKPVPSTLASWMTEARKFETALDKSSGELSDIIVRICGLFSNPDDEEAPGNADPFPDCISAILSLDEELETWSTNHKSRSQSITPTETENSPSDHFPSHLNQHDLSSFLAIAHTRILCSSARIILHEKTGRLVSRHIPNTSLPNLPSSIADSYDRLRAVSDTATRTSVKSISHTVSLIRESFVESKNRTHHVRAGCFLALIWPLLLAGTAYTTMPAERDRISRRLGEIGELTGAQRARTAAGVVRGSRSMG